MCVMCAYVGTKNAAQELWKMGTAIEGLWSGFYTGLATLDPKGIHMEKCCGWSKYWKEAFRLADLPGNIGLFHSRTKSGGGSAWAHPFVGTAGKVVLVSQGSDGVFSDMKPFSEEGTRLQSAGKRFLSSDFTVDVSRYPVLGDGARVHISEVVAHAAEAAYERCGDPLQAVRDTTLSLREEAISLFLFKDFPDRIYFSTVNQRLVVHFAEDGAYAASSALAFGLPIKKYVELPTNSVGYFTASQFYSEKLPACPFPFHDFVPDGCLAASIAYLREKKSATLADLTYEAFGSLFPKEGICLHSPAAQRIGEILCSEGIAELRSLEVEGVEGRMGLQMRFFWKE